MLWLDALSGSTIGANSFCLKAWDSDKWDESLLVALLTSWSPIALANSSSRATFASFAMQAVNLRFASSFLLN
jgi:hypothetical protein